MKFLVDAQLPRRLALWFQQRGHDVIHTIELIQQNRTPDPLLLAMANQDDRALVTKDTDFEITHELGQGPPKLLLITTGNIHNNELLIGGGVCRIRRTVARCCGRLQTPPEGAPFPQPS